MRAHHCFPDLLDHRVGDKPLVRSFRIETRDKSIVLQVVLVILLVFMQETATLARRLAETDPTLSSPLHVKLKERMERVFTEMKGTIS